MKNKIKQQLLALEDPSGFICENSWLLFPTLTFEGVQEVDISNCQMPLLKPVVLCFSKSFPYLKTLKAANYLKLPTAVLYQLVQWCPLLNDVDLSVDISPIIPTKVCIKSSHPDVAPQRSRGVTPMDAVSFSYNLGLELSNITNLTLEGRTDMSGKVYLVLQACLFQLSFPWPNNNVICLFILYNIVCIFLSIYTCI